MNKPNDAGNAVPIIKPGSLSSIDAFLNSEACRLSEEVKSSVRKFMQFAFGLTNLNRISGLKTDLLRGTTIDYTPSDVSEFLKHLLENLDNPEGLNESDIWDRLRDASQAQSDLVKNGVAMSLNGHIRGFKDPDMRLKRVNV